MYLCISIINIEIKNNFLNYISFIFLKCLWAFNKLSPRWEWSSILYWNENEVLNMSVVRTLRTYTRVIHKCFTFLQRYKCATIYTSYIKTTRRHTTNRPSIVQLSARPHAHSFVTFSLAYSIDVSSILNENIHHTPYMNSNFQYSFYHHSIHYQINFQSI